MKLEEITGKLSKLYCTTVNFIKEEKDYCDALALLGMSRVPDIITTSFYIARYGSDNELNPFVKVFINKFGTIQGLVIQSILAGSLAALWSYRLNKKYKGEIGTFLLNTGAVYGVFASSVNLLQLWMKNEA